MNRILIFVILTFVVVNRIYSQAVSIDDEHRTDGEASYYAKKFQGRKTANGETFNNYDYTAAHRTLPFNTYLNVINKDNNFNVIVRVNDRGPYAKDRIIDLTEAAARRIGGYHHGLVHVRIDVLDILHPTPELEKTFTAAPVVDCLGNIADPEGVSLSLWSTGDLLHAVYVANDLYLKENVNRVYIGNKMVAGKRKYFVLISGIPDKATALSVKDEFQRKGFMRVNFYSP
jgi:rare lipoprotein A